jgi:hypothetical protein
MRTRRSPRNQEILWRELGNVTKAPKRSKIDILESCLKNPDLMPKTRRQLEQELERARQRELTKV